MKFTINNVNNIWNGEKGFKLQLTYNGTKTRTFEISKNLKKVKKRTATDFDNNHILESRTSEIQNNYNFEKANETKNILIQSINFMKEKIRKMMLLDEFDYVIENERSYITIINEVLTNVNNKLISLNTPKQNLLYSK